MQIRDHSSLLNGVKPDSLRLFFATDIHGSTRCFEKLLGAVNGPMAANVLVLGGDISAKQVLILVTQSDGRTRVENHAGRIVLDNEHDVEVFSKRAECVGMHIHRCDEEQFKNLKFSPHLQDEILKTERMKRLAEWLQIADAKLKESGALLVINCGNDDHFYLDSVLDNHPNIVRPEGTLVLLPGNVQLVSCGYSIETPWKCPRDEDVDEAKMHGLLEPMLHNLQKGRATVFNLHCPPHGTTLDKTARLDSNYKPVLSALGIEEFHAGSVSVREAIESYQPALSLHGHIHGQHCREWIGKTVCYNPGSFYEEGRLTGVFATFQNGELISHDLVTDFDPSLNEREESALYAALKAIPGIKPLIEYFEAVKKSRTRE